MSTLKFIEPYYNILVYLILSVPILILIYNQRILKQNEAYYTDTLREHETYKGIVSGQHLNALYAGDRKLTDSLVSLSHRGQSMSGLVGKQKMFFVLVRQIAMNV